MGDAEEIKTLARIIIEVSPLRFHQFLQFFAQADASATVASDVEVRQTKGTRILRSLLEEGIFCDAHKNLIDESRGRQ